MSCSGAPIIAYIRGTYQEATVGLRLVAVERIWKERWGQLGG